MEVLGRFASSGIGLFLAPSCVSGQFLLQETGVDPRGGEKRKEKRERGDGAKEEDEITAGELLWLSALRAQRLKVNLEILHSLLIGRHFFPLRPTTPTPPPTRPRRPAAPSPHIKHELVSSSGRESEPRL